MSLRDQAERTRFVEEMRSNISVIAPAGVGKTTAIVQRIVRLAQLPTDEAVDQLTRLVVVTFSVSAAQQLQQRARVAIRSEKVPAEVQRAFQQTFFGTIHSYCVRLLDRFGHYLGLPSPVGLLQDDTELWQRFLLRGLKSDIAADKNAQELFHFYPPDKLYALGKVISPGEEDREIPAPPNLDFGKLLDFNDPSMHSATRRSIVNAQQDAAAWLEAWKSGEGHHAVPECPPSPKARTFAEVWGEAFQPFHDWLREAAHVFGLRVANAYERFRLLEAVMSYDDQVRLAVRVLKLPEVRLELAEERLSVLLDEAQDTDKRQFEVLRRVAGLGGDGGQQADQNFSIVGDFQQAIYAPRSDLGMYQKVHDEITTGPRGLKSELTVTFRCDRAIIQFVNAVFPTVLIGEGGQSRFQPLLERDSAGPGQVVRWTSPVLTEDDAGGKISADMRSEFEARFLARRLKELQPLGLGVSGWEDVAILCPRKAWLYDVKRALLEEELPVQLHSSNEKRNDRLTGSWFTALVWIAAHPEDEYEIAGVLREIFGVADSEMAEFTRGKGERLRLCGDAPEGEGSVATALRILHGEVKDAARRPLAQSIGRLVRATKLRDRLALLEDEVDDSNRELDDLLALTAARAAEQMTLADFAEELHAGLAQDHPGEEEIQPAIQLLTSYKSKGLEWPVVIVPFMFRNIASKPPPYPRVDPGPEGEEVVSRDGDDFARRIGELVEERERQQLQRLLYVTMTRARRTLIFVDDEAHYGEPKTKRRNGGWPSGDLLHFRSGVNHAVWEALPAELIALPEAAAPKAAARKIDLLLPRLEEEQIGKAILRAGDFPRRTTPHSLAVHPRADAEPEVQSEAEDDFVGQVNASGPGVRYGTWWHELAESIPWAEAPEVWEKKFEEAHAACPQPARGAKEWKLFRQSKLAAELARAGQLVQVELPFLWQRPDGSCLEGVMDLAVRDSGGTWHVIDWKTNRVEEGRDVAIADIYREQVRAYMTVLRGMLPGEVRGSLYLTQTGALLPIE